MARQEQVVATTRENEAMDYGALIALGVSLGTTAGIIFGNIAMGASLGLIIATIVRLAYEKRQNEKGAGVGLAISIGGLLVTLAIWALVG